MKPLRCGVNRKLRVPYFLVSPPPRPVPKEKGRSGRGAAKFREETPRKGGGLAIKDRDTALQQYAETSLCLQALNCDDFMFFPRKYWKKPEAPPEFSAIAQFYSNCAMQ